MEKYQTLQDLSQIGIFLCLIGVAACGWGSYYYGKKIENTKNIEMPLKIDSNVVAKTAYQITGDLIQGNKIDKSKKEEINAPSALIVTQNQSGGQNTINFYQNEYIPLSENIEEEIEVKLQNLVNNYPKSPRIIIEIESNNSQRNKIALALEKLLSKNNLGEYPKGNIFSGRFPDYPISVFINPNNSKFTNDLIKSLELFVIGEYEIVENENWPLEIVKVYINGQPLFDTNGKVKIQ